MRVGKEEEEERRRTKKKNKISTCGQYWGSFFSVHGQLVVKIEATYPSWSPKHSYCAVLETFGHSLGCFQEVEKSGNAPKPCQSLHTGYWRRCMMQLGFQGTKWLCFLVRVRTMPFRLDQFKSTSATPELINRRTDPVQLPFILWCHNVHTCPLNLNQMTQTRCGKVPEEPFISWLNFKKSAVPPFLVKKLFLKHTIVHQHHLLSTGTPNCQQNIGNLVVVETIRHNGFFHRQYLLIYYF